MKEIPIKNARAFVALVDDEDYERVMQHTWYLAQNRHTCYCQRSLYKETGKRIHQSMHVFIMGATGLDVDHKDGNGLNNQKSNLRLATRSQNNANSHAPVKGRSDYRGVVMNTPASNWKASIRRDGKKTYLGSFKTEEEAARAYDKAAKEIFGEFATLNFPDE